MFSEVFITKFLKLLFALFSISLLGNCSNQPLSRTPFSIIENEKGIELLEDGKIAFFYQRNLKSQEGNYTRNNYVHPLYNLDGEVLTEDFPKDHPHHRGIFWAWHQIYIRDSLISDSWELKNFEAIITATNTELNKNSAVINIDAEWISSVYQNGKPYLKEKTSITLYKQKDNLRIIDYRIELKALVNGLKIGGSNNDKGYGGFSTRIKMPDNLRFSAKSGNITPQNLQINAGPWMDFSGSFGASEKISGITILCHPTTPNYPQPWILRQTRSMQNIVFPGQNAIAFPKNKPIVLNYRLILHNGGAIKSDIEKWFGEYSTDLLFK